MNRNSTRKHFVGAVAATVLALASAPTFALDYLWVEKDAATGAMSGRLGELDSQKPTPLVLGDVKAQAGGKDVAVSGEAGNRWVVPVAAGAGDVRLTGRAVAADGSLNFYQARFGRQDTKAVNDLELVPTQPGGNTFKLYWKGTAVSAAQVNVSTSEGWQRSLKPAADGTVTLATPFPGLYVMELTAKVNGSTTVDGKKYDDVRHTATLSFQVE